MADQYPKNIEMIPFNEDHELEAIDFSFIDLESYKKEALFEKEDLLKGNGVTFSLISKDKKNKTMIMPLKIEELIIFFSKKEGKKKGLFINENENPVIYVCDDSDFMRGYIQVCLKNIYKNEGNNKNILTKFFGDSSSLLNECKTKKPDLVFTDLNIEKSIMNGITLSREIKKINNNCHIYLWSNLIDEVTKKVQLKLVLMILLIYLLRRKS